MYNEAIENLTNEQILDFYNDVIEAGSSCLIAGCAGGTCSMLGVSCTSKFSYSACAMAK